MIYRDIEVPIVETIKDTVIQWRDKIIYKVGETQVIKEETVDSIFLKQIEYLYKMLYVEYKNSNVLIKAIRNDTVTHFNTRGIIAPFTIHSRGQVPLVVGSRIYPKFFTRAEVKFNYDKEVIFGAIAGLKYKRISLGIFGETSGKSGLMLAINY